MGLPLPAPPHAYPAVASREHQWMLAWGPGEDTARGRITRPAGIQQPPGPVRSMPRWRRRYSGHFRRP